MTFEDVAWLAFYASMAVPALILGLGIRCGKWVERQNRSKDQWL